MNASILWGDRYQGPADAHQESVLNKYHSHENYLKRQKTSLRKCIWRVLWLFSLAHVPSTNIEEAGFMTYTTASHQGRCFGFTFHHVVHFYTQSMFVRVLWAERQMFNSAAVEWHHTGPRPVWHHTGPRPERRCQNIVSLNIQRSN